MIESIIQVVLGFASGLGVAAGMFSFISILGVIPRLCACFHMAKHVYLVESCVALGSVFGTIISLFSFALPVGQAGLCFFGIFAGTFIGALAMALAETLRAIPILCQRLNLRSGLPFIILMMALGKAVGSFVQLFFWR